MKKYFQEHRAYFGILGTVFATIVAIVYFVVLPAEIEGTQGVTRFILQYGHSLCWLLLAAAAAVWGFGRSRVWAGRLAYAALTVYIVFIITLLSVKFL